MQVSPNLQNLKPVGISSATFFRLKDVEYMPFFHSQSFV